MLFVPPFTVPMATSLPKVTANGNNFATGGQEVACWHDCKEKEKGYGSEYFAGKMISNEYRTRSARGPWSDRIIPLLLLTLLTTMNRYVNARRPCFWGWLCTSQMEKVMHGLLVVISIVDFSRDLSNAMDMKKLMLMVGWKLMHHGNRVAPPPLAQQKIVFLPYSLNQYIQHC